MHPDALEAALSLPDGINPGGCTKNSSLRYKCLERLAHRVSGGDGAQDDFFPDGVSSRGSWTTILYFNSMVLE